MSRWLLAALLPILTASCAHAPKPVAARPVIKSIAIIPATDPTEYAMVNDSAIGIVFPIGATIFYIDAKEKARQFNARMLARPSSLASILTDGVADALRGDGYQVQILEGVLRPPNDPDDVDYEKISTTADVVLHVQFKEVGVVSPRSSPNFSPRVTARGTLFVKGREIDQLYDEDIYYGFGARDDRHQARAIAADERYVYQDFDAVMNSLDELGKVFETGAREISARISQQVRDTIK